MTTPNHLHKTTVPRLCPFSPLYPSISHKYKFFGNECATYRYRIETLR